MGFFCLFVVWYVLFCVWVLFSFLALCGFVVLFILVLVLGFFLEKVFKEEDLKRLGAGGI